MDNIGIMNKPQRFNAIGSNISELQNAPHQERVLLIRI
jgi:hypothetical protein